MARQPNDEEKKVAIDKKSGSLAYNRLDMQLSQTLHMAIELYDNLNYLLVPDHDDDITLFDDDTNPEVVSYYQMKTNEESISIDTAISEDWLAKLYEQLSNPKWLIDELGLITNCPLKLKVPYIYKNGKNRKKEKIYTVDKTPFLNFDPAVVKKIKEDIAKKKGISVEEVDLSKFVHMRTTLSIAKHREIVQQEMNDFLKEKYPSITVEMAKTIFSTMMDLLARRQGCERLNEDAPFIEVKKKKGISKADFSRVITDSMLVSIPRFDEIERVMEYSDDEKYKASYEYTRIMQDLSGKSESFRKLLYCLKDACEKNVRKSEETIRDYCNRLADRVTEKNILYNKTYVSVLICCVLINGWE